jgi:MoaD family protein
MEPRRNNLNVTVEYLGYIKQTLNIQQAETITLNDKATVHDLLVRLAEKHGEPFKKAVYHPADKDLQPHHILALNGLMVNLLNGLDTKLKDGDRVTVMPVVTGG